LTHLYINAITPPPEVQQAIDDRSRMGAFKDMHKLMQMKAAMAMEEAAQSEGGVGAADGMGAGLGLMLPAMFAQYFAAGPARPEVASAPAGATCPECRHPVPVDAKFCPQCGHQQVIFHQCQACGKNLTPGAKFCPRCGRAVAAEPQPRACPACGAENLADALYCNQCGEKL
jgi:membrane protease subunit (stomatin/prohibitin family)